MKLDDGVNDYEVLGIGGLRQRELLARAGKVRLLVHPAVVPPARKEIYQALLIETIAWLKPVEIVEVGFAGSEPMSGARRAAPLDKLFSSEFKKSFPRSAGALGELAEPLLQKYLDDFPWQGPLVADHFRYFSPFVKEKVEIPGVSFLVQKEWLKSYLSFSDFGRPRREEGIVALNPSLQPLRIPESYSPLGLAEGLYLYFAEPETLAVREYPLDYLEAAVLDLLEEDRKFTFSQVIEQLILLEFAPALRLEDPQNWSKILSNLISQGIILL